jgi:hypothetical protein
MFNRFYRAFYKAQHPVEKCAQIRTAQVVEYLKASMNDDDLYEWPQYF